MEILFVPKFFQIICLRFKKFISYSVICAIGGSLMGVVYMSTRPEANCFTDSYMAVSLELSSCRMSS